MLMTNSKVVIESEERSMFERKDCFDQNSGPNTNVADMELKW